MLSVALGADCPHYAVAAAPRCFAVSLSSNSSSTFLVLEMLVPILGTLLSYKLVLVLMFILGDHAFVIAFTYLLGAQSAILWVSRSLVCVC